MILSQPFLVPRPPVPGRNSDDSHRSPVGRKAAVDRPGMSQFPVSHGHTRHKARPSTAPK
ncbi:hypothetical protein E2C01_034897 [Portunus trituberculatus]|uniref:Uncharacterized protein n=1 Tax=Portunus trituberculatus TaxID=210409 RepID=A0A5B7F7V1_PORTR|nr:hypothetical protein [Portunus trituberculatus]